MAYQRINYYDFAPYSIERVAGRGVKKVTWDNIVAQHEVDSFGTHLMDERKKVLIQTTTSMPFNVYIVPASEVHLWNDYIRNQQSLRQIFNCVYLLWGHDFICAGKSVNSDPILGLVADETNDVFDYQMLFVPNNENPSTMMNWTSDFMAYLESLLIDRIKEGNPYCKDAISGKINGEESKRP